MKAAVIDKGDPMTLPGEPTSPYRFATKAPGEKENDCKTKKARINSNVRKEAIYIVLSAMLLLLAGCSSPPKGEACWRTADEGSFTLEIPTWLRKVNGQGMDSHVGQYCSPGLWLDFDEVYGLGYTREEAKARHDKFARAFKISVQDENSSEFIKQIGDRYARYKIGRDKKWVNSGYPGEYAVEVFVPDVRGGYLSVWITYSDPSYREIAVKIGESIKFKDDPQLSHRY